MTKLAAWQYVGTVTAYQKAVLCCRIALQVNKPFITLTVHRSCVEIKVVEKEFYAALLKLTVWFYGQRTI